MGTAVMVTSGKGGTGKTSLTAGVGSCLAALGRRVLCVDVDIGLRNLDLVLGLSDRAVMDFSDVMDYRCSLLGAATEQPEIRGLFLLTAPLSPGPLDLGRFCAVVAEAKDYFDFVLMDSPAGLGDGFQLARAAADRAVVVSAVDPAALRDAQRAVAELHDLPQLHLVMNRVQPKLIHRQRHGHRRPAPAGGGARGCRRHHIRRLRRAPGAHHLPRSGPRLPQHLQTPFGTAGPPAAHPLT